MTRPHFVRGSSLVRAGAITYVAVAFAGTLAILIAVGEQAVPPVVVMLWLLYLGPLGMVVDVVVAATDLAISAPGLSAVLPGAAFTLIFTGAASLNVLALRRLRRMDGHRPDSELVGPQHRLASGVLFAFSGAAFVVLTFFAGFFFLVAYGVDTPTPDPLRVRLQTVAAGAWLLGLGAAVAGLVIWIRGIAKHRPTLRFAVADLAAVVTLTALVVVNSSIGLD